MLKMNAYYTVEFPAERMHLMKMVSNTVLEETWSPTKYKHGDLELKYIQPISLYDL